MIIADTDETRPKTSWPARWLPSWAVAAVRYSVVGGISRLLQTVGLLFFVELMGLHYVWASLLSVAVVHILAFAIHWNWTFRK